MTMNLKNLPVFLRRDLWRARLRDMPPFRARLHRALRMVTLTLFQFQNDKCTLRASALTFFTLMSIVPVLALSFGIAKGFGFEKVLERELRSAFQTKSATVSVEASGTPAQPSQIDQALDQAITFANKMLENTKGGLIAGIGLAVLLWTVVKVLGHIEGSFNDIWGIKKSRPWLRKFADYLSFLFITPILLFLSSSTTVFITSQVTAIINRLSFLGALGSWILLFLGVLPFVILWVLFTFTYMFMPNTKVRWKSGLAAGILAGSLYQLIQWIYINAQFGAASANAIYGSFAALPLFLTWLQVSWMVVLLGAEFSYAHQNIHLYEWMEESKDASQAYRRLLMLAITHCCVRRFCRGWKPPTPEQLTQLLDAPPRLVRECVDRLIAAQVLVEVLPGTPGAPSGETGYHPATDVESLTVMSVLEKLDLVGYSSLPLVQAPVVENLSKHLKELREAVQGMPANVRIKDIEGELVLESPDQVQFTPPEGSETAQSFPL